MHRIALTGPESTGKSTLAEALAEHFETVWVPEMSRGYLDSLDGPYTEEDLHQIAVKQISWEDREMQFANKFLFCDTDPIVTKIWYTEVFGPPPVLLKELAAQPRYHLHILCAPDIPWEYDPLRENPHDRDRLFDLYLKELTALQKPFIIVKGSHEERMEMAISAIQLL